MLLCKDKIHCITVRSFFFSKLCLTKCLILMASYSAWLLSPMWCFLVQFFSQYRRNCWFWERSFKKMMKKYSGSWNVFVSPLYTKWIHSMMLPNTTKLNKAGDISRKQKSCATFLYKLQTYVRVFNISKFIQRRKKCNTTYKTYHRIFFLNSYII